MWRFATAVVKGGMCPRSMTKPEQVLIALQMGAEVGLTPMQSLKNIAVINGTPSIWGDALVALVRRSPLCKSLKQPRYEGQGETRVCIVEAERSNGDTASGTFGYADAKRAGLLSKDTYRSYPDRMYYRRAVGNVCHELFPDLLLGLDIAEEVQDMIPSTTIESGDDAPLDNLDAVADLLEKDEPIDAEFDNPADITAEEAAELF